MKSSQTKLNGQFTQENTADLFAARLARILVDQILENERSKCQPKEAVLNKTS